MDARQAEGLEPQIRRAPQGLDHWTGRATTECFSVQLPRAYWIRPEGRAAARGFHATRSPERVPFLRSVFRAVYGCSGGCDAFLCAAIASLTTSPKTPEKFVFFKIVWSYLSLPICMHLYICQYIYIYIYIYTFYIFPNCVVKKGYIRDDWHSFGRGKMKGLRRKNNIPKKQRMQIGKKANFFESQNRWKKWG